MIIRMNRHREYLTQLIEKYARKSYELRSGESPKDVSISVLSPVRTTYIGKPLSELTIEELEEAAEAAIEEYATEKSAKARKAGFELAGTRLI